MDKKEQIGVNYLRAQIDDIQLSHIGQLENLNGVIELKQREINSLQRTVDDQSSTISKLRTELITLDKELQSLKGPSETVKQNPDEEQSSDEEQCDCLGCQLQRIVDEAKASGEIDQPSEATKQKMGEAVISQIYAGNIDSIFKVLPTLEGVQVIEIS